MKEPLLQWYADLCSDESHRPLNKDVDEKLRSFLDGEMVISNIYEKCPIRGWTMLDYACFCGHSNVLRWLISPLPVLDSTLFQSAQNIAINEKHEDCLRVLSEFGTLVFPEPREACPRLIQSNVCSLSSDEIFRKLGLLTIDVHGKSTFALFPIYHQLLSNSDLRITHYTRVLFDVFLHSNWRISVVIGDDVYRDSPDPNGIKTRGYADRVEKKVCVATDRESLAEEETLADKTVRTEREVCGTVIHELAHAVCDIIWNHESLPYVNDIERNMYLAAYEQVRRLRKDNASGLDELINGAFIIYHSKDAEKQREKELIELIVRVPELIIREGVGAIMKLQQQVPLLFWYYQTVFLPKCQEYLHSTATLEWLSDQLNKLRSIYDKKICGFLRNPSTVLLTEKEGIQFFVRQCEILLTACDETDFHGGVDNIKAELLLKQSFAFDALGIEKSSDIAASLFKIGLLHCEKRYKDLAISMLSELEKKVFQVEKMAEIAHKEPEKLEDSEEGLRLPTVS